MMPTPDDSPSADSVPGASTIARPPSKQKRVLACVLCQQRKVKCDRNFPCVNCVRSGVQCVPAALVPRQRRRRFAERELLDRIREYEGLLDRNDIKFNRLHPGASNKDSTPSTQMEADPARSTTTKHGARQQSHKESTTLRSEASYETKSIWQALKPETYSPDYEEQDFSDFGSDEIDEFVVKDAVDRYYGGKENLLFGMRKTNANLSSLHPDHVQIFKLWQVYLNNVDPLLKVTHHPTLQTRIIEAVGNIGNIERPLEALMFGIYSTAVMSLDNQGCLDMFGMPKTQLQSSYQLGCQQALMNCDFLTTHDRDCLTAVLLYMLSIRTDTHPSSMSAMLGATTRIAQRMGIHNEAVLAKSSPFEAEMRRRLWWALVAFDARISEQSEWTVSPLIPIWDCKIPLNVNDFDLLPGMTSPPTPHERTTEALCAVLRAEMSDFTRNSTFFLDYVNPALKVLAKDVTGSRNAGGDTITALEEIIEQKYLQYCTSENPLHFLTIWTVRGYLAKTRLMEHFARHKTSIAHQTDAQRATALAIANRMLECDSKLLASADVKRYRWLLEFQFPFPAYMQVVAEVRRRPLGELADKSWTLMDENYRARFKYEETLLDDNPLFMIFGRMVLQAWAPREAALSNYAEPAALPQLITDLRSLGIHERTDVMATKAELQPSVSVQLGEELTGAAPQGPVSFVADDLLFSSHDPGTGGVTGTEIPLASTQDFMDMNMDQFDWPTANWMPNRW